MAATLEQIKEQCAELTSKQKADLAYFLLHTLDDEEAEDEVAAAWQIEIERRMTEVRAGRAVGKLAEQVSAELREKYS